MLDVSFEILIAVLTKNQVFWGIRLYWL